MADVKLHIGCGENIYKGWTNLDLFPYEGVDVVHDITTPLPFDDNMFDHVYSEDVLEHIPQEKKVFIINEIWRILKPGGLMEHRVPNAGSANDFGSPTHISHWSLQQFEHFNVDSYRYAKDARFEGIKGGFKSLTSELTNWNEKDNRHQSLHVVFSAVK
jgi:predicted SAM-dependent methyltransferase